jgi:hypothetical protein
VNRVTTSWGTYPLATDAGTTALDAAAADQAPGLVLTEAERNDVLWQASPADYRHMIAHLSLRYPAVFIDLLIDQCPDLLPERVLLERAARRPEAVP